MNQKQKQKMKLNEIISDFKKRFVNLIGRLERKTSDEEFDKIVDTEKELDRDIITEIGKVFELDDVKIATIVKNAFVTRQGKQYYVTEDLARVITKVLVWSDIFKE